MSTRVPPSTSVTAHVMVIVPENDGSSDWNSTACTTRSSGASSTKRASTTSESPSDFPPEVGGSIYVRMIRYDPPARASNRSNRPVIPCGGSHSTRACGSTSALYTRVTGASITREAVSVRPMGSAHRPARSPRGGGHRERPTTQTFAGHRFQTCTTVVVESLDVVTGRTDTECVGLPPLFEGRMHDVDRNGVFLHIVHAGG